jgi:hypothetical protein
MGFTCESGEELTVSIANGWQWTARDGVLVDYVIDPVDYSMADVEEACQS